MTPDTSPCTLDALRRDGYLTVADSVVYGAFPSRWALYKWIKKHDVRTYRRGKRLLLTRKDIDEALTPTEHRTSRQFFTAVRHLKKARRA